MQETPTLRNQRGATLVEYALVIFVFLLLILGIMEFARVIFTYNTLANAAREGARYGIIHAGDGSRDEGVEGVKDAVVNLATGLDSTVLRNNTSITWDGTVRVTVQVTVSYPVDLITGPFIQAVGGTPNITLQAVSTMRLE